MMHKQWVSPVSLAEETPPSTSWFQAAQKQATSGRGQVILIVEDHLPILEVIETALEYLGYQTLIASNGLEALEVYHRHRDKIDLVLSDVRMPEIDGLILAQILHEQNPAVKVVLLTAYPLDVDQEAKELLSEGIVVGWLEKPVGIEQLARTVNRVLKQKVE